jgi:multidrug efflux pump subunit AcrB
MIIVIGILADDGIVVLKYISIMKKEKHSEAAVDGTMEVIHQHSALSLPF